MNLGIITMKCNPGPFTYIEVIHSKYAIIPGMQMLYAAQIFGPSTQLILNQSFSPNTNFFAPTLQSGEYLMVLSVRAVISPSATTQQVQSLKAITNQDKYYQAVQSAQKLISVMPDTSIGVFKALIELFTQNSELTHSTLEAHIRADQLQYNCELLQSIIDNKYDKPQQQLNPQQCLLDVCESFTLTKTLKFQVESQLSQESELLTSIYKGIYVYQLPLTNNMFRFRQTASSSYKSHQYAIYSAPVISGTWIIPGIAAGCRFVHQSRLELGESKAVVQQDQLPYQLVSNVTLKTLAVPEPQGSYGKLLQSQFMVACEGYAAAFTAEGILNYQMPLSEETQVNKEFAKSNLLKQPEYLRGLKKHTIISGIFKNFFFFIAPGFQSDIGNILSSTLSTKDVDYVKLIKKGQMTYGRSFGIISLIGIPVVHVQLNFLHLKSKRVGFAAVPIEIVSGCALPSNALQIVLLVRCLLEQKELYVLYNIVNGDNLTHITPLYQSEICGLAKSSQEDNPTQVQCFDADKVIVVYKSFVTCISPTTQQVLFVLAGNDQKIGKLDILISKKLISKNPQCETIKFLTSDFLPTSCTEDSDEFVTPSQNQVLNHAEIEYQFTSQYVPTVSNSVLENIRVNFATSKSLNFGEIIQAKVCVFREQRFIIIMSFSTMLHGHWFQLSNERATLVGVVELTNSYSQNCSIVPLVDSIAFLFSSDKSTKIIEIGLFGDIRRTSEINKIVRGIEFPFQLQGKARKLGEWC